MRIKLCEALAEGWREAENSYLDSGCENGEWKDVMYKIAQECELTEEEQEEVEAIAQI